MPVGGSSTGIVVDGASPLISSCTVREAHIGIRFIRGAGGRLEGCTVENCQRGVVINDRLGFCTTEVAGDNVLRGNASGDVVQRTPP